MNLDNKTICITGCVGFVGMHLVERLAPIVVKVEMVGDFPTGNREKIEELLKRFRTVEFYKVDVQEYDKMKKFWMV